MQNRTVEGKEEQKFLKKGKERPLCVVFGHASAESVLTLYLTVARDERRSIGT